MFRIVLKALREDAKMSQYDLANCLNISQSTVGMWESGRREPGYETTARLADFFGVSTDYLLGRTNIKKPALNKEDELVECLRSNPKKLAFAEWILNLDEEQLAQFEKLLDIVETLKAPPTE